MWTADNFPPTDISFLSVIVKYYKPNRSKNHIVTPIITEHLHNSIPCEHKNKFNEWVADNLAPLDLLFLSISSLTSSKTTLALLFITSFL